MRAWGRYGALEYLHGADVVVPQSPCSTLYRWVCSQICKEFLQETERKRSGHLRWWNGSNTQAAEATAFPGHFYSRHATSLSSIWLNT